MARKNIIIAGLGNPGSEYEYTRHNIGFLAIDKIATHYSANKWQKKFNSHFCEALHSDFKLILVKPQSYMNRSGESIVQLLNFYKLTISDLLVIHDDLDLAETQVKYKIGGSAAGHNGLKSIDKTCGQDYARLRIGIGRPPEKIDVSNYVLSRFSKQQLERMDQLLEKIAQNMLLLLQKNQSSFFSQLKLPS